MRPSSFSYQVKEEFLELEKEKGLLEDSFIADLWLGMVLASSATFMSKEITVKSQHRPFIETIDQVAKSLTGEEGDIQVNKNFYTWKTDKPDAVASLRENLEDTLGYEFLRANVTEQAENFEEEERMCLLRAVFLAVGSMAAPEKSYQIALSFRRPQVLAFCQDLLDLANISNFVQESFTGSVLYIKNGDCIADFLAETGANKSYLDFESVRVRKNMNEQVNRTVNFDTANMGRIAESAARQIAIIKALDDKDLLDTLPDELQEVARVRFENPGYSLRELGDLLVPPIGKSGVYHRLGKLETLAKELLEEIK
jgi:DNA-binding protein WhiA